MKIRTGILVDRFSFQNNLRTENEKLGLEIEKIKLTKQALRSSEERSTKPFKASPVPMAITLFRNGRFIDVNESFLSNFGYSRDEVIGCSSIELSFWSKSDRARVIKLLNEQGAVHNMELDFLSKSGKQRSLLYSAEAIEFNGEQCILSIMNDITERRLLEDELRRHREHFEEMVIKRTAELKKANEQLQREMAERRQVEKALRESEEKYRTIFRTTGTAVIIIEEDTTISLANEEFEKLSGYSKSDVEGKASWKQFFQPEYVERMVEYHYKRGKDLSNAPKSYESRFIDRCGNIKDVLVSVSMIPGTKKSVASFVDIRTIKQAEAQLKYIAMYDYLTSIPNRYSFEESLKKAVAKAKHGRESALLLIDIDNFKLVNDTKGHAAGDDLLISVANTIKENLRKSDFLARLGGDEFGVMLEETTIDEARLVAEKLRLITEGKEFCFTKHGCFNLSLSIGVVMIDGALNSQRLLSLADTALYAAKDKGRNRVVLLDPDEKITVKFAEINRLVAQVKNAVKEDNFVLHFQPVVRVDNGKIVHHEALVRLKGKDGRLISPQVFIPAAERFGLMPQVDRWVVKASLEILRRQPVLNLFINISGASLSEASLLVYIEEMIKRSGLEPSRIGFEITETAAVKDMMLARRWIERLKKLGCQFALDDFGIGFSSFSYLRMLPVDYLKIDGSFIRNLDKDPSHRALVEAMSTIAHSLGKKTIVEYVENINVLKIMQELKTDFVQGYYLGLPADIADLQLVSNDHPKW